MRGKLGFILACALPGLMLCMATAFVSAGSESRPQPKRFALTQSESIDNAGLTVTDRNSGEAVSVLAVKNQGLFIAFYEANSKSATPRLAISAQGLQLRTSDGKITFVTVNDLARVHGARHAPPKDDSQSLIHRNIPPNVISE